MVLQPAVRTAAGVATGAGGLLPHLFILTVSLDMKRTAVVFCYGYTNLRPSGSFTSAAPCVARTFLPSRFAANGAGSSGRAPLLLFFYCRFILHCAGWNRSFFEKKEPKKLSDSCATLQAPQSSCIEFLCAGAIDRS